MKFNLKTILIIVTMLLLLGLGGTIRQVSKQKKEIKRLENNYTVLTSEMEVKIAENGQLLNSVRALELTKNEAIQHNEELKDELKNANIKIRDLEGINRAITQQNLSLEAEILEKPKQIVVVEKDTTYIKDINFEWKDTYNHVYGLVDGDKINMTVKSTDNLTIYHHKEYCRFLWINWKLRNEWFTITNVNPSVTITDFSVIKMKK